MSDDRTAAGWLFALLLLLQLAVAPGYVDNVDSRIILHTAERLMDDGTWSLGDVEGTYYDSPEYGGEGPDGARHMKFGAGNAVLAIPFVAAGRLLLGGALGEAQAGEAGWALSTSLWFALAGVLVFRLTRRIASRRTAVGAALLHSLCGYALAYGRSSYLDTTLTVFVLLAYDTALAARDERHSGPGLLLGAACGAALWIKVASAVYLAGLVPVVFCAGARRGWRTVLLAAGPFVLLAGLLGAVNHARFGAWWETGYAASMNFRTPVLEGVWMLTFSERGGLLFFAPCALLGLFGLMRLVGRDLGLGLGVGVALVLGMAVHGKWTSPVGGEAWGPRYILPLTALLSVPAALMLRHLLAGTRARRAGATAVIAFAAVLQVPSTFVSFTEVYTLEYSLPEAQAAELPPHLPLSARIGVEKLRGGGEYALDRIAGVPGTYVPRGVERGPNVWPVRVAERLPARSGLAWAAFSVLLAAAAAAGTFLVRGVRGPS